MKKLLYLVVAALMCIVPLVGCQSAAPTPIATTVAPTVAATVQPPAPTKADGPDVKYDPGITVNLCLDEGVDPKYPTGQDYLNNVFLNEWQSELGIKVNYLWEAAGLDEYETKLNLAIASNQLPDIIDATNQSQMSRLIDAGLVADLTDVYNQYASDAVKANFTSDGGAALKQVSLDGKLWAIPYGPAVIKNLEFTYLRQDWMNNLGLSAPKTTEDLLNIIEDFTKNDPDKDGKPDTYGLLISNEPYENYMELRGFFNCFGAYPTTWILKDGKLAYGSVQPEMKTALTALAQLYKDGCIDKEFVAKNAFDSSSDAVAGKGGVCFGQFWLISWPLPDTYQADNKHFWKAYPITSTAAGTTYEGSMAQDNVTEAYMVRKGYEHPEVLLKMYNNYNDKLNGPRFDQAKYHTDPVTGNDIFMLSPIRADASGYKNERQSVDVTKALDTGDTSVLATAEEKATYQVVKDYKDGKNIDESHWFNYQYFYGADSVFGISNDVETNKKYMLNQFYGADTPEMLRRMSILLSQEEQMILDIVTGNKPVDSFDDFVKNWNDLGGETITYEVNQWYTQVK